MGTFNDEDFKIKLEANAVPLNDDYKIRKKIFQHAGKEAFIVGQKFKVTYTVTNIGKGRFTEGLLSIVIQWPEQPPLKDFYYIEKLEPNESQSYRAIWGVQSVGFNTFSATFTHGIIEDGFPIRGLLLPLFTNGYTNIFETVSFFSIFGQTAEEFYQYWAMILAAASLTIIVFGDYILPLLKMIAKVLLLIKEL